jgi:hypothetical protein
METLYFSETSVPFYEFALHHNPEEQDWHILRRENVKCDALQKDRQATGSVLVGFVVEAALGQVFLRVLRLSPVSAMVLHARYLGLNISLTCGRSSDILSHPIDMNKTYSSAFLAYYLRLLTWHALYSF